MQIRTLVRFLLGDRDAILELSVHGSTLLWVGLPLALSAVVAQVWDEAYLLGEPTAFIVPILRSVLVAGILVASVLPLALRRGWAGEPGDAFALILGMLWLTAPLSWIHIVAFDRLAEGKAAVYPALLIAVSLTAWRALIITRVVDVLFGAGRLALLPVLLVFDLALLATVAAPGPMVAVPGGPAQATIVRWLAGIELQLAAGATVTAALLIIAWLFVFTRSEAEWEAPRELTELNEREPVESAEVRGVAILAVVLAIATLVITQDEQRLRSQAEADFRAGRAAAALDQMASHGREAYPPGWSPPVIHAAPKTAEELRILVDCAEAMADGVPDSWATSGYRERIQELVESGVVLDPDPDDPESLEATNRLLKILPALPWGLWLIETHQDAFRRLELLPEGAIDRDALAAALGSVTPPPRDGDDGGGD